MEIKYSLVGRYMEGSTIIGYQLQSENESLKVKRDTLETMVEQGIVNNCKVIKDNGKTYIKGVGIKISELPALNMLANGKVVNQSNSDITGDQDGTKVGMELVGRMLDGDTVIGYVVKDSTGSEYKLPCEKVWQLTRAGSISNAQAQISGKFKLLLGVGIEIHKLPSVQVSKA